MSVERWRVQWVGTRAIVTFPDEVDATNAHDARDCLVTLIEQDDARIVVADLSQTTFCDSAGITALATARRKAVAYGAVFALVCSSPQVLRILELTGLDQMLRPFASVDEVLG